MVIVCHDIHLLVMATFGLMVWVIISAPLNPTSSCTELVMYKPKGSFVLIP